MTQQADWLNQDEMTAWLALLGVSIRILDLVDDGLRRGHGVSGLDYGVLVVLSERTDGLRAGELADEVGDSTSCLAHRIRRLEAAGLVQRTADEVDRRGRVVRITAAGRDLLRAAAPAHVRLVRENCIDLLTVTEQRQLGRSLGRVLAHLRADPRRAARH